MVEVKNLVLRATKQTLGARRYPPRGETMPSSSTPPNGRPQINSAIIRSVRWHPNKISHILLDLLQGDNSSSSSYHAIRGFPMMITVLYAGVEQPSRIQHLGYSQLPSIHHLYCSPLTTLSLKRRGRQLHAIPSTEGKLPSWDLRTSWRDAR